jgi:hypothetical protein
MMKFNPLVTTYAIDYKPEYRSFIKVEATEYNEDHTAVVKWAVRETHFVMSKKTGEFEYEPSPSSRTQKFFKEYRFDTAEEAITCYQKFHVR